MENSFYFNLEFVQVGMLSPGTIFKLVFLLVYKIMDFVMTVSNICIIVLFSPEYFA